MKSLPTEFKFRKQWRTYQRRVLLELEDYLQDDRIHLVAAPGSGKTVLGLEIIRRLNSPTLILAPTLTIRNQWIDRMVQLFLPEGAGTPDWITTNIKQPGLITVSTYQGLHSVFGDHREKSDESDDDNGEMESLSGPRIRKGRWLSRCRKANISVLVVDEAHHLRKEWWKTLTALKEALHKPKIVSLTATPPYDVNLTEWERYEAFCGPLDAEISVPELVKEQNLCPHQDYVYFSRPLIHEQTAIEGYRRGIENLYHQLRQNQEFIALLQGHPWITQTEQHIDEILSNPEYMSSMILFLKQCGASIPSSYFRILGISSRTLPPLSLKWAEILLTGLLFEETRSEFTLHPVIEILRGELGRLGAIENRRVVLTDTMEIHKLLSRSAGKLDSIGQIVRLEAGCLGDQLRCVILTDYIFKEALLPSFDEKTVFSKIGAGSIFETLRRAGLPVKLGVLTGSVVVVPTQSVPMLVEIMNQHSAAVEHYQFRPLETDPSYSRIEAAADSRQNIVKLITQLFSAGGITVLVGTKSLLGEGWDEPSVNSLILASFAGTFMLTNQMRGRAIRVQPGNPQKAANIWHLVCVESDDTAGADYITVVGRFKTFTGVSDQNNNIENGIERLGAGEPPFSRSRIERINTDMRRRAAERNKLAEQWHTALSRATKIARIVEEIKAHQVHLRRGFVYRNTAAAMLKQGFLLGSAMFLRVLEEMYSSLEIWQGFKIALIVGAIAYVPTCFRALRLFVKNMPVESYLRQISLALIRTLQFQGQVKTIDKKPHFITRKRADGHVYCGLTDGTSCERNLFINALQEILNPIQNPRYLLISRHYRFGGVRTNYFAVPQVVGQKKKYADYFAKMWNKYIGDAELVYTRNEKGRKILLKARMEAMSAAFVKTTETMTCWK